MNCTSEIEGADGLGAVGQDVELDAGRQRGLQLRQLGLDQVDGLDHVGAGLALNGQDDRRLFVDESADLIVLGRFDDVADVADTHRRAVAVGDDQVLVGVRLEQLIVGAEREGLVRTVQRALWLIDVGLHQHVADVFEADAAIGERLRIDLHADGRLLLAADADQADAPDLREFRHQDVFGIGVDRGERQRIGGEPSTRIGVSAGFTLRIVGG